MISMPLLMAQLFAYESDPLAHGTLRRALGKHGGAEGFTAAARAELVSHGVTGRKGVAPGDACENQRVPLDGKKIHRLERVVMLPAATAAAWAAAGSTGNVDALTIVVAGGAVTSPALSAFVADSGTTTVLVTDQRRLPVPSACHDTNSAVAGSIAKSFLSCTHVSTVDFSQLTFPTAIDGDVLSMCACITSVDLSGLTCVTTVGDNFLAMCPSIQRLDLAGLTSVTTIGNGFLLDCESLTSVDFSALRSLTSVSDAFVSNCSSLKCVDLSQLTSLTSAGYGMLCTCESLTEANLSGLTALTSVDPFFMAFSSSLKTLDLRPLARLESVGHKFLHMSRVLPYPTADAESLPAAVRKHLEPTYPSH